MNNLTGDRRSVSVCHHLLTVLVIIFCSLILATLRIDYSVAGGFASDEIWQKSKLFLSLGYYFAYAVNQVPDLVGNFLVAILPIVSFRLVKVKRSIEIAILAQIITLFLINLIGLILAIGLFQSLYS